MIKSIEKVRGEWENIIDKRRKKWMCFPFTLPKLSNLVECFEPWNGGNDDWGVGTNCLIMLWWRKTNDDWVFVLV